jgi:hypothetical protein
MTKPNPDLVRKILFRRTLANSVGGTVATVRERLLQ